MDALFCKGDDCRHTGLREMLKATGKPFVIISAFAHPQDIIAEMHKLEKGTILVIEDIDNVEPTKLKVIFDRMDGLK